MFDELARAGVNAQSCADDSALAQLLIAHAA
jgi:hypothetical protein